MVGWPSNGECQDGGMVIAGDCLTVPRDGTWSGIGSQSFGQCIRLPPSVASAFQDGRPGRGPMDGQCIGSATPVTTVHWDCHPCWTGSWAGRVPTLPSGRHRAQGVAFHAMPGLPSGSFPAAPRCQVESCDGIAFAPGGVCWKHHAQKRPRYTWVEDDTQYRLSFPSPHARRLLRTLLVVMAILLPLTVVCWVLAGMPALGY
jgi:hypothetical protein